MVRTVPQRTGAFLRIDPIGQIEFVEPILARNIISNLLPGRKCRCQQRQIGERRRSVIDGERSEIGLKNILLFSIEIDGELGGRRNTTVTGRSRLRNKFVVVARYISQESNIPTGIYLIGKIGLIIEKKRFILTFGIEGTEQGRIGFKPKSMQLGETLGTVPYRSTRTQETARYRPFKRLWLFIGDVEYRRHFITVFHRITSRRKSDRADHIGIDKTQSFLLSGAYQLRAVYLYPVDIDNILVEISTSYRILRTQFVIGVYAGHSRQQSLDRSPRSIGHQFPIFRIDFLQCRHLTTILPYLYLAQCTVFVIHTHRERNFFGRIYQFPGFTTIPEIGKHHLYRIGRGDFQFKFTLLIGKRSRRSSRNGHGNKIHRPPLRVNNFSRYFDTTLRLYRKAQEKKDIQPQSS